MVCVCVPSHDVDTEALRWAATLSGAKKWSNLITLTSGYSSVFVCDISDIRTYLYRHPFHMTFFSFLDVFHPKHTQNSGSGTGQIHTASNRNSQTALVCIINLMNNICCMSWDSALYGSIGDMWCVAVAGLIWTLLSIQTHPNQWVWYLPCPTHSLCHRKNGHF